jgi:hypothetical protein
MHRPTRSGGGGKKLGLYACCLVVAGGSGYWLLHSSHGDAIPVVTADASPVRVRPANPGGLNVNQAENFILSGDSNDSDSRLAAPPEAPNTKALRASEKIRPKSAKPTDDHLSTAAGNGSDS